MCCMWYDVFIISLHVGNCIYSPTLLSMHRSACESDISIPYQPCGAAHPVFAIATFNHHHHHYRDHVNRHRAFSR